VEERRANPEMTLRLQASDRRRLKREARAHGLSANSYIGYALRTLWVKRVALELVPPLPWDHE